MFYCLSKYKKVNSGGKFLNNVGGPIADKITFESKHKFSICFDNCSYPGYTTEKIIEAFAARTIPIYWGDPKVSSYFNDKAFINVMDYDSIDKVVERIVEVDNDDSLYISMLREPALKTQSFSYESIYERFSEWLCSIIEQPLEKAKRTPTGYWNTNLLWNMKMHKYAYENPYRNCIHLLFSQLDFLH